MGIHSTSISWGVVDSDPEIRNVGDTRVLKFTVRVDDNYKDRATGKWKTSKTWYQVEVWGDSMIESVGVLQRGDEIHVGGRVRAEAYIKKDGSPAAALKLRANSISIDNRPAGGDAEIPF